MRISNDPQDTGYQQDVGQFDVTLDGELVHPDTGRLAIAADEETGRVVFLRSKATGADFYAGLECDDAGEPVLHIASGAVQIRRRGA